MRLSERLSEIFYEEGLISSEDKEVIQFGIESMEGNLAGVLLTFFVGILFGALGEAILFYIWFLPLRKSIGGFHADTKLKCLLTSAMALLVSFALFTLFRYPNLLYLVFSGVFVCIIFIFAPVDNPGKKFDAPERSVYRRRSRIVLTVESLLFAVSYYNSWNVIIISLCMAFFVASISLLLGLVKNIKYSRHESKT